MSKKGSRTKHGRQEQTPKLSPAIRPELQQQLGIARVRHDDEEQETQDIHHNEEVL